MKQKHIPFANIDARGWQNLALLALAIFYIINTFSAIFQDGLFKETLGTDFLSFWSAGHIANESGYANAYNLTNLTIVQQQVVHPDKNTVFYPLPAPVLPIFLLPFQILSFLGPELGFIIWVIINLVAFFTYSIFFLNWINIKQWQRLTILTLLSFPVFYNIYCGQVNLGLEIFIGEFFRNVINREKIRSGLWLGGLLLKPQVLVLIVPFLIIRKEYKTLIGFMISTFCVVGFSLWLGGKASIVSLIDLWIKFTPGLPRIAIANMMNYRMIVERLSGLGYPIEGWVIASIGTLFTLWFVVSLWRKYESNNETNIALVYLGTIAGTLAVTWHAHIHMAMILIPTLLYLCGQKLLPEKLLNLYVFGVPFATFILSILVAILGLEKYNALIGLIALCTLLVNLTVLVWANHMIVNHLSPLTNK